MKWKGKQEKEDEAGGRG